MSIISDYTKKQVAKALRNAHVGSPYSDFSRPLNCACYLTAEGKPESNGNLLANVEAKIDSNNKLCLKGASCKKLDWNKQQRLGTHCSSVSARYSGSSNVKSTIAVGFITQKMPVRAECLVGKLSSHTHEPCQEDKTHFLIHLKNINRLP